MTHHFSRRRRLALWAGLCLALGACIDTKVSLGHHEAPLPGDGDGDGDSNMMDASMTPSGGSGGASGSGAPGGGGGNGGDGGGGSGGGMAGGMSEPPSPCDTGTLSATLECDIEDPFGGQAGAPPPRSMSTRTTLTIVRIERGLASVTGVLAFEPWGLSFDGRIEGELDCMRGTFHAVIANGVVMMQDGTSGGFYGELDGLIDPFDGTISGPWWHGPEPQRMPRCLGPWQAQRD